MVAPITRAWLKPISMYFPKRLLLSFLVVLAFPKAWQKGGSVFPGAPGEANPLTHPFCHGLKAMGRVWDGDAPP